MANILILGGGFGGLIAAERLAEGLDSSHQITLISPNRRFTFHPSLVHFAFGECTADEITFDLRAKLAEFGVHHIQGEMIGVNPDTRRVQVAGNEFNGDISYDVLLIATGRRLATEKVGGFFEYAEHLLGINAALSFGEAVRTFRRGNILVGLCPDGQLPVPVCETAFALARRFEDEMRRGEVTLKVIFPGSLSDAFGGADLHKQIESAFEHHGINVLYDVAISRITEDTVFSTSGHEIPHDLLMLVPPFRGNAALRGLGATDASDFVKVDPMMRVVGNEMTYAVGDITALPGPKLAHMAVRQAEAAAANILSELRSEPVRDTYYHEIAAIIDAGGPDSIYLRYGIFDEQLYGLRKGRFWGIAKEAHDAYWHARHG